MIVLDTNVVSEFPKPLPSKQVVDWLAAQDPATVCTTTITQAEILYGVELLASGRRRASLQDAAERMFHEYFVGRILPFDEAAARAYGNLAAALDRAGHRISRLDAMIAAIARSQGAAIATRNVADFQHCGVRVINPWSD